MDKQKIITSIIKKYPTPIKKECPRMILRWNVKQNGLCTTIHRDITTGVDVTAAELQDLLGFAHNDDTVYSYVAGGKQTATYMFYYSKERVIEISSIMINCRRAKEHETRQWEFYQRYFIFLDIYPRTIVDERGIPQDTRQKIKVLMSRVSRIQCFKILKQILPTCDFHTPTWLCYAPLKSELTRVKAPSASNKKTLKAQLIEKGNKYLADSPTDFSIYLEFAAVIRNFQGLSIVDCRASHGENQRLYFDGQTFAVAKERDWTRALPISGLNYGTIVNPEEMSQGCFKHYASLFAKPSIEENPYVGLFYTQAVRGRSGLMNVKALALLLQHRFLEQFYKIYGSDFVCASSSDLDLTFGENRNEKAKDIYGCLKLNKYQLDSLVYGDFLKMRYASIRIRTFREVVGDNARSLDRASTDWYIKHLNKFEYYFLHVTNVQSRLFAQGMIMKIKTASLCHRLDDLDAQLILISDIMRSWEIMGNLAPELNLCPLNELERFHDYVIQLSTTIVQQLKEKEYKRRTKEQKKVVELRQQFEYEDEEYIIRLPKTEQEILDEGKELKHCVGGYAHRCFMGDTTIMFLRKKSEPEKPFYTIEVLTKLTWTDEENATASFSIAQIHGYCNCWLGNNPEAIPTVLSWLRKNKIKCNKSILTSTSKRYSIGNDFVELPEVA